MCRIVHGLVLAVLLSGGLAAQAPLEEVCETFTGHDVDGDGDAELRGVRVLLAGGGTGGDRVLALVEERLTACIDLRGRLARWQGDLAEEGLTADVLAVEVYSGPRHQDGRTVLALRRLLRAWRGRAPGLRGVVLVGHFPDAMLVRTVSWRKHGKLVLHRGEEEERRWKKVRSLRRWPELVAHRCDLVLGDLDGRWEACYVQPETELMRVNAVFGGEGVPEGGGEPTAMEVGSVSYRDFFHVADGACAVRDGEVVLDDGDRDHECTAADRERGNPLARAEIWVSRIDARGVAWSPREEWQGQPLRDGEGRARRVSVPEGVEVDVFGDLWRWDAGLELRLLGEYFDRNHRDRTRPAGEEAHRPASIAHGLPSGQRVLRRADEGWGDFDEEGYDLRRGVDLVDLVEWYRRPAVLRTMRAHSDARGAVFAKTGVGRLHGVLAEVPLGWAREGDELVPSLQRAVRGGRAGFFLYRALWEQGALGDEPHVMLHTGCRALSPPGSRRLAYDREGYGRWAHGESVLFFTPAVAVVGRAKVFYDEPRGFAGVLREGGTVGDALRRYGELESRAASWGKVGGDIGRKRSYFWSVLGDGSLRLRSQ